MVNLMQRTTAALVIAASASALVWAIGGRVSSASTPGGRRPAAGPTVAIGGTARVGATSCSRRLSADSLGVDAHLFVTGGDPEVALRYTIINGALPAHPDYNYPNVYFYIAVDGVGNFYAAQPSTGFVSVYPPGKVHPSRTIEPSVPGAIGFGPNAIAADQLGYLYYSYSAQLMNSRIVSGIYIYAPGASGMATPVQSIALGHEGTPPVVASSLAVDPSGNLYVQGVRRGQQAVVIYSQVLTAPKVARVITGPALSEPTGITVDQDGELYVVNGRQNNVVVYAASASGRARPERTITIMCLHQINGHVVLLGNDALAADYTGMAIVEFDKRVGGLQNPIKIVQTPIPPLDLAIGLF